MSQDDCLRRDPVELLLKNILRSTLLCAGACSVVGCGEAHVELSDAGVHDAGGDAGAADAGMEPGEQCQRYLVPASGLSPAQEYDYLAVREITLSSIGEGPQPSWSVHSKVGEPCAEASDKPACESASSAPPDDCVPVLYNMLGCTEVSIVTRRGDEVRRWAGTEATLELLGDIDAAAEAQLVAVLAGYKLCGDAHESGDGYELNATAVTNSCPVKGYSYVLRVDREGTIEELSSALLGEYVGCPGRLPDGLCSQAQDRGQSQLGDLLARAAHLEAASVFAFERLAQELSEHGAPAALVQAALAARADEIEHACTVSGLARARGGDPVEAQVAPCAARTLEEIARENAVEGCIRETYAALVGAHQAARAEDLELRQAMQQIADDEARHASLSHQVHAWILPRLDAEARARVRASQRDAVRELCLSLVSAQPSPLQRAAGLPPPSVARSLVAKLARTLWADVLAA